VTAANSAAAVVTEKSCDIASWGDRIIDAGDIFSYFRIARLRVYSYGNGINASAIVGLGPDSEMQHAIAFTPLPIGNYTAPTGYNQVLDFPEFKFGNGFMVNRFTVGPQGLYETTPTKWYSCGTQGSAEFNSAGVITSIVSNSQAASGLQNYMTTVAEAVFEFKEPIDTSLIPTSVLRRRIDREEKLINDRDGELVDPPPVEKVNNDDRKSVSNVSLRSNSAPRFVKKF
jgi:hypothetical protein